SLVLLSLAIDPMLFLDLINARLDINAPNGWWIFSLAEVFPPVVMIRNTSNISSVTRGIKEIYRVLRDDNCNSAKISIYNSGYGTIFVEFY
ncbi:hypothetical protein PFISCL1PPCAC_23337, partial [Pristionchus fissidentatus]